MIPDLFANLILVLVFGASIGLERESSKQGETRAGSIGGIRTFSLISLTGTLAGILVAHNYSSLALIVASGFILLLISNYVSESFVTHDFGITSELSALVTFLKKIFKYFRFYPR